MVKSIPPTAKPRKLVCYLLRWCSSVKLHRIDEQSPVGPVQTSGSLIIGSHGARKTHTLLTGRFLNWRCWLLHATTWALSPSAITTIHTFQAIGPQEAEVDHNVVRRASFLFAWPRNWRGHRSGGGYGCICRARAHVLCAACPPLVVSEAPSFPPPPVSKSPTHHHPCVPSYLLTRWDPHLAIHLLLRQNRNFINGGSCLMHQNGSPCVMHHG